MGARIIPGGHTAATVTWARDITIKKRAQIGIGARIIPGVTIGEDAIVGAGAVIVKDVPAGATVVGNPGKIIKLSELGEQ